MPFKSRRLKEKAQARRFEIAQTGYVRWVGEDGESKKSTKAKASREPLPDSRQAIENLAYVKSDLVKIVLLATLVIAAQILLALTRA